MRFYLILALALAVLMQLIAVNGVPMPGSQALHAIGRQDISDSVAVAGSPPSGQPPHGPPPPRTTTAASSG
ncbi:hypothetical protein ACLKA7_001692 [Drosophila subpalustris]